MDPSSEPQLVSAAKPASPGGLSVGSVAARLGVAPATVRSWGRRYGLVPSGRTTGGHRRYTEMDVADLARMQTLVAAGATPSGAAATVMAERPAKKVERVPGSAQPTAQPPAIRQAGRTGTTGGPGGRVLAVPGASSRAQGLARAASRLDAEAIRTILGDLLHTDGSIATWEEVLRPVLGAVGTRWARTGEGIDIEHVLSEATIDALRSHRAQQPKAVAGRQILLACAAGDLHVLPLHLLGSALAERGIRTLLLGARVPGPALVSAARRTRAAGIFLWRQQAGDADVDIADLCRMRPAPRIVVGGPGWDSAHLSPAIHHSPDLTEAVDVLASAMAATAQ